ncbi:MAG: ATP synthase F1 subunit gamma, partial [Candidatus Omnitrophica bacterium]|nr:ATP synthase F1 subunit gamma [Candidatus Omnitrophota bacterium]
MSQSLRQIKNRIRSIENTEKVTSAMQMVSSSKLNRMDNILASVRPYFEKLVSLMDNVLAGVEEFKSPYIQVREKKSGKICLCVIASDGGLCGVYNNNIIHAAEEFIKKHGEDKVSLVLVGKKGFNYFKRHPGLEVINTYIGLNGRYSETVAKEILKLLTETYLSGKVDEVYICYAHFINALTHKALVEKFLNLDPEKGKAHDYIFDPDRDGILEKLIPMYVGGKFRLSLLEAFTSEHAARTVAMKMATENARDMLQSLTLLRNKVRQAKITEEMLEIIS